MSERHELQQAIERLSGLSDQLRQSLTDSQWQSIPKYVYESAYSQNLGANVPMVAPPMVSDLVLIRTVTASVPTGSTGVLQLGSNVLYLPAGTTTVPCGFPLFATDTRSLTVSGGGAASLWLFGEQLAPYGSMAP